MNKSEKKVSKFFKEYLDRELAFSTYYGIALHKSSFFEEVKRAIEDFETKWKPSNKQADSPFAPSIIRKDKDTDLITLTRSQRDDMLYLLKNTTEENYTHFMQRYALQQLFSELDNYLISCFRYIMKKNPSILENTSIQIKDVDKDATFDKIIDSAISDKLHNVFYKNYASIFNYAKTLGVKHKISAKDINNLKEFKLLRDLYVHSDGFVNKKFLEKTKLNKHLSIGVKIPLKTNLIIDLRALIRDVVLTFDCQFNHHFPETINQEFQYERFLKNTEVMSQVFPAPPKLI